MNSRYCLDANILIESWNLIYSIKTFPSLWKQISQHRQNLILIKPIYDEIEPISPADRDLSESSKKAKYPLRMWLIGNKFPETPINRDVEELSLTLEKKYQIGERAKGASQTDITLIAYVKKNANSILVTSEELQLQHPKKLCNYKIPLICEEENVECIRFPELLKGLGIQI